MSYSLTDGQETVLKSFYQFGLPMDDQALTVYTHHIADESMSSSGIRSRRAELSRTSPPLIEATGTKRLSSGRNAVIHGLSKAGKKEAERLFSPKPVKTAKKVTTNVP